MLSLLSLRNNFREFFFYLLCQCAFCFLDCVPIMQRISLQFSKKVQKSGWEIQIYKSICRTHVSMNDLSLVPARGHVHRYIYIQI